MPAILLKPVRNPDERSKGRSLGYRSWYFGPPQRMISGGPNTSAMEENNMKTRVITVVSAVITFLVSVWLFTNWEEFKAGLSGTPEPQAKSQP